MKINIKVWVDDDFFVALFVFSAAKHWKFWGKKYFAKNQNASKKEEQKIKGCFCDRNFICKTFFRPPRREFRVFRVWKTFSAGYEEMQNQPHHKSMLVPWAIRFLSPCFLRWWLMHVVIYVHDNLLIFAEALGKVENTTKHIRRINNDSNLV